MVVVGAVGDVDVQVHLGIRRDRFEKFLDQFDRKIPNHRAAILHVVNERGTTGEIDESVYSGSADTGSNFRIDSCRYIYNLSASGLGVGTYRVDIKIDNQVVGSAIFQLK